MRKVTFGVANSLDNYIARADHSVDWLRWSDGVAAFVKELWKPVDAVLMGRRTYEARSLFEADLIDEVGVNVHPVLLGSGVPLFPPMARQIDLQLTDCRQFEGGCVLLRYAVVRPGGLVAPRLRL